MRGTADSERYITSVLSCPLTLAALLHRHLPLVPPTQQQHHSRPHMAASSELEARQPMPAWLWREAFRVGTALHEHRPWWLSLSVVPVGWSAAMAACAADHCRRSTTAQATLPTPWARSTIKCACSMQYRTVIVYCTMSLVMLFHPGVGHQRHRTTWQQSLSLLSCLPNVPVVAGTLLNAADQQRDLAELTGGCGLAPLLKWYFTLGHEAAHEVGHCLGCNVTQLFADGAADSRVRCRCKSGVALGVRDARQSTSKHNNHLWYSWSYKRLRW